MSNMNPMAFCKKGHKLAELIGPEVVRMAFLVGDVTEREDRPYGMATRWLTVGKGDAEWTAGTELRCSSCGSEYDVTPADLAAELRTRRKFALTPIRRSMR
ncbi:hypothetical protein [Specibacter sp. RAF43]|uniref:hypothetical protein n=1 Tax=Specibacter sp. RAF43 TaxID=3233057 RepID=UPI003F9CCB93